MRKLFFFIIFIFALFSLPILAEQDILLEEEFLLEEELLIEEKKVFLEPPIITEIPEKLKFGENLIIRGISAYPDIIIRVFVQKENEQPLVRDVKADKEGSWVYFYDEPIKEGIYNIWAIAFDGQTNQSLPSEKFSLTINSQDIFQTLKKPTVVIALLLFILAMTVFCLIHQKRKEILKKRFLKNKTEKTKKIISKVFKALREEVKDQVFEKKPKEELEKALKISEKIFKEEVEEIEKKLK